MSKAFQELVVGLKSTPIVKRSSFGFNLTNLGECITTIRITPGIEESDLFLEYAKRIARIGGDLFTQVKRRRRTPLQADGASKAPPHENGTR
jgi:hypothetical protein